MSKVLTTVSVLIAQAGFGTVASAAPTLSELALNRSVVAGCQNVIGTVRLTEPAPAGGLRVTLSDTLLSATVPVTLTLPQGVLSKNFIVSTKPVTASKSGKISASFAGTTLSQNLTVRRMGLSSLTLLPTSVASGHSSTGTAKLECKAGPGPVTVALSSSKPAIATPVATSIVVSAGLQSQPFDIMTTSALSKTSLSITGSANGISKSKTLWVTPAATVAPSRLAFGEVNVYESAELTATLSNVGTSPYAIVGITLTGSGYYRSNKCPANLAAGASCRIRITFAPDYIHTFPPGTLSIATSATSSPLKVALTGTGVCIPFDPRCLD